MDGAEESRRQRAELKRVYGSAYVRLSGILFDEDPVGINFEVNEDEYEPEAGTILPRLRGLCSADDVRQVVHEELAAWFGTSICGPPDRYQRIAERILDEIVPLMYPPES